MRRYAEQTAVPAGRSIEQIKWNVGRFGATEFGYHECAERATVGFVIEGLRFEMMVPLPDAADSRRTPTGKVRAKAAAAAQHNAEIRRRWRALAVVVKALLVAVDEQIMDLRQAFMPYIVMANGVTVAENLLPVIEKAAKAGELPSTLKATKAVRLLEAKP